MKTFKPLSKIKAQELNIMQKKSAAGKEKIRFSTRFQ